MFNFISNLIGTTVFALTLVLLSTVFLLGLVLLGIEIGF